MDMDSLHGVYYNIQPGKKKSQKQNTCAIKTENFGFSLFFPLHEERKKYSWTYDLNSPSQSKYCVDWYVDFRDIWME